MTLEDIPQYHDIEANVAAGSDCLLSVNLDQTIAAAKSAPEPFSATWTQRLPFTNDLSRVGSVDEIQHLVQHAHTLPHHFEQDLLGTPADAQQDIGIMQTPQSDTGLYSQHFPDLFAFMDLDMVAEHEVDIQAVYRRRFGCPACGKTYTEERSLVRHERTSCCCSSSGTTRTRFPCSSCDKNFARSDIRQRHEAEVHLGAKYRARGPRSGLSKTEKK